MDQSIKKINDYRANTAIVHEPVILRRLKSENITLTYLVYPCIKEDIEYILTYKTLSSNLEEALIKGNYITKEADITNVYHCGELSKFTGYTTLVYKFPQRKIDIRNRVEAIYRCYEFSRERQVNHINVHNMCPTAEHSWMSAVRKVGSEYGLILKIKIVNNVESTN